MSDKSIIIRASANMPKGSMELEFYYTNYKGEYSKRRIDPYTIRLVFGEFPYHEGAQWFMHAFDIDKDAIRTFAFKDIGQHRLPK